MVARILTARFVTAPCGCGVDPVACTAGLAFEDDVTAQLASELGRAQTRLASRLGVAELDQLAAQWSDPTSPVGTALRKSAKVTALPTAGDIWATGAAPSGEKLTISKVNPKWTGSPGSDALFLDVRTLLPAGQTAPETVLIRGRFAARMAAQGSPIDADVLGSDSASGRAFYEQLSPVSAAALPPTFPLVALTAYSTGAKRLTCPPPGTAIPAECFVREAHDQAETFFKTAETDAIRFGAPATLPVHIRVLAAANAMAVPPGMWPALPPLRVTGLVAASQGQLDPPDLVASSPLTVPGASSLDYSALPEQVVWDALEEVDADPQRASVARARLAADPARIFPSLGSTPVPPPVPWTREAWGDWADHYARPGQAEALQAQMGWRALEAIECAAAVGKDVCTADDLGARMAWNRALLRRHLRFALASTLDPGTPEKPAATAPKDHVKAALGVWKEVLEANGIAADLAPQAGPLGVDPTAVCSLGDGPDAQKELVERAIDVDVAFVLAGDSADTAAGVPLSPELGLSRLWDARTQLPFVALDDPSVTTPQVVMDGVLPSGARLYHARWRVWTGWHLLWGAGSDGTEINLRFAALCDDMGLAPPGLLPSLVDAALEGGDPVGWGAELRARVAAGGSPTVVAVSRALSASPPPGRPAAPPAVRLEEAVPREDASAPDRLHGEGRAILLDADGGTPTPLAPDVVQVSLPKGVADAAAAMGSSVETALAAPAVGVTRPAVRTGAQFQVGAGALGALGVRSGVPLATMVDIRTAAASRIAVVPGLSWSVGAGALVGYIPDATAWEAMLPTGAQAPPSAPFFGALTTFGLALQPAPAVRRPRSAEVAWGATAAAGSASVPRVQAGIDAVGLVGADTDGGVVGGVFGEPWVAWSITSDKGRAAFLRPYSPRVLIGPSVRVGYEFASRSVWAGAGLRVQAPPPPGKKP